MGAKETIMSPQDIKELKSKKWGEPARNYDYTIEELMVAEAQAEITGEIMKQEGRMEVVKWFEEQTDFVDDEYCPYYVMNKKVWQNQLKEWGVK